MATTVGSVITAARDYSPYFDRTRIPGGTALRLASQCQRELMAVAGQLDPDVVAARQTGVSVAALNSAISINAHELVTRVEAVFTDTDRENEKVPLVSGARSRLLAHARAAYLENGALYLTGEASDWEGVASVTVWYVPLVADFTTESTNLTLPDDAAACLTAKLALLFGLRVSGMPIEGTTQRVAVDVAGLKLLADDALASWRTRIVRQRQAQWKFQRADVEGF